MNPTTVDPDEIAKFARHAAEWWQKDGAFQTLHDINPVRLDYIERFCKLKNQRVLDIGCGGGILAEGLARCGAEVTGLDMEADAIEVAITHAKEQGLSINYVCQPIETFEAKSFPIITCLEMLEHVADPELVLKEAARLLMPGGYLFLSTINRNSLAYFKVILAAEYVLGLLPRRTHDYQRFLKPSELAGMLRKWDLDVLDLTGLQYSPFSKAATLTPSLSDNYLLVARSAS